MDPVLDRPPPRPPNNWRAINTRISLDLCGCSRCLLVPSSQLRCGNCWTDQDPSIFTPVDRLDQHNRKQNEHAIPVGRTASRAEEGLENASTTGYLVQGLLRSCMPPLYRACCIMLHACMHDQAQDNMDFRSEEKFPILGRVGPQMSLTRPHKLQLPSANLAFQDGRQTTPCRCPDVQVTPYIPVRTISALLRIQTRERCRRCSDAVNPFVIASRA